MHEKFASAEVFKDEVKLSAGLESVHQLNYEGVLWGGRKMLGDLYLEEFLGVLKQMGGISQEKVSKSLRILKKF